jgi:hypothetical protein
MKVAMSKAKLENQNTLASCNLLCQKVVGKQIFTVLISRFENTNLM